MELETNLFKIIDNLSHLKVRGADDINSYVPFVTNRYFSLHPDSVLYASRLNVHAAHLSPQMHYDHLFYAMKPRKRFWKGSWPKPKNNEFVGHVCEYFKCSAKKAQEIIRLLTDSQLQDIRDALEKGGTAK